MQLLHRFRQDITGVEPPLRFNNPFYYLPHRLCVIAVDELRAFLLADEAAAADAANGKMFGVLVVEDAKGGIGFLAAFSGLLAGRNMIDGFVPPVFDFLSPDGYFKCEESEISSLNTKIRELETVCNSSSTDALKIAMEQELSAMRESMRRSKQRRDALRAAGNLTADEEAALIRESQFQKAELKRLTASWEMRIADSAKEQAPFEEELKILKEERKQRSAALQEWLFMQFRMKNAIGEERTLLDIFSSSRGTLPPAGAGECAAPKLLQYAYLQGYKPLAMAEFWVGETPVHEIRRDGCFYGSCKSKCEPILSYMLQGLDVEENALEKGDNITLLSVLFEDEYLVVVDKPSGVLSVPGIVGGMSVQQWLREKYLGTNELFVVHRLDMATSGILVAAKSIEVYKAMQQQFASRQVGKRYMALLDGIPVCNSGVVELPISSDYENRPLQRVDYETGKEAVTRYRIVDILDYEGKQCALVQFEPLTGRTHQLRVHAAHPCGLDAPIIGDALYGTVGERLMLHASELKFQHPVSGEVIEIVSKTPFGN